MDPTTSPVALAHLAARATTIAGRLAIVQEQAARVLGRADEVAAWMAHYNPSVLNGLCPISLACQNPEGFRQVMAELDRIASERSGQGWVSPAVLGSDADGERRQT